MCWLGQSAESSIQLSCRHGLVLAIVLANPLAPQFWQSQLRAEAGKTREKLSRMAGARRRLSHQQGGTGSIPAADQQPSPGQVHRRLLGNPESQPRITDKQL